jgi:archaellum component FlaC
MNGEDFKRFEQIVINFKEEVKAEFRHQIGIQSEDVKAEFRHQIGIQSEHFQHKLDIVVEGHEVLRKEIRDTREELCEKIKFVDFKVEVLNQKIDGVRNELGQKIDAVAADISAHRADTEVHKKVYKVKED